MVILLSIGYNNFNLLKSINFKIETGDLTFITGPSGCGKTTLLDIICGLIKPNKGRLYINGDESIQKLNSFRNKIYY